MVSRKHVPLAADSMQPQQVNASQSIAPYPTSPVKETSDPAEREKPSASTDAHKDAEYDLIDMREGARRTRSDSDASHGTWDTDSENGEGNERQPIAHESDIPKPLRITPSKQNIRSASPSRDAPFDNGLPAILRPGPAQGSSPSLRPTLANAINQSQAVSTNPWIETESNLPIRKAVNTKFESNNPFRSQSSVEPVSSQSVWQDANPNMPTSAPPLPPPLLPTVAELPAARTPAEELQNPPWTLEKTATSGSYKTVEVIPVPPKIEAPVVSDGTVQSQIFPTSNPWRQESGPELPAIGSNGEDAAAIAGEALLDGPHTSSPRGPPSSQVSNVPQATLVQPIARAPPPSTAEIDTTAEHYSIKCINWFDAEMPGLRRTPILTQSANGPCPLLAMVNAVTLSTPHHVHTALIETLQARETISLRLLLDAVFDELMSERRVARSQEIPDVDELYAFLLALHTGMNVNPCFVGHSPDVRVVHQSPSKFNWFEKTREMHLYSIFDIELLHGWIPAADSPEYAAFERTAHTFEDAQNVQFGEFELQERQHLLGLSNKEAQTLQDIKIINNFLNGWPTQLSDYGLEAISHHLRLGQVAILFRNNHFSTVYKEPEYGTLMTLVTDAGYSSHDEIVWESLVDVNGSATEMFSGDFRVVSHSTDARLAQDYAAGEDSEWQTVPTRTANYGRENDRSNDSEIPPPLPGPRPVSSSSAIPVNAGHSQSISAREQEDHDLALALQLQEEEEDEQRQAIQRRQQEQRLSEQMLSSEAEGPRPQIPPRRSNNNTMSSTGRDHRSSMGRAPAGRPAVNRPTDDPADPDAPPSYQQAASDRPYRPDGAAAQNGQGNPLTAYDALLAQQGSANAPGVGASHSRRHSANRPGQPGASTSYSVPGRYNNAAGVKDAEEKCVVM